MIDASEVTIVIPAYNVAEYIGECLSSVLENGGETSKIVVIDDGSTDDTPAVILDWAHRHSNIEVHSQPNAGQAVARNRALERCTTNFITFVDSDDRILPGGLTALYEASGHDVDITFSNRMVFFDNGKRSRFSKLFRNLPRGKVLDLKNPAGIMAPHGKLYRIDFLLKHNIRFPQGIHWEDVSFTYKGYLHAETVASTATYTYGWRKRSGANRSTMQKLLTPHSLESRRKQIALTETLRTTAEWRDRFGERWAGREFGHRLMMHLKALVKERDKELRAAAFETIRSIVEPYQEVIRERHADDVLAMYEAIFAGDLARFLTVAKNGAVNQTEAMADEEDDG